MVPGNIHTPPMKETKLMKLHCKLEFPEGVEGVSHQKPSMGGYGYLPGRLQWKVLKCLLFSCLFQILDAWYVETC